MVPPGSEPNEKSSSSPKPPKGPKTGDGNTAPLDNERSQAGLEANKGTLQKSNEDGTGPISLPEDNFELQASINRTSGIYVEQGNGSSRNTSGEFNGSTLGLEEEILDPTSKIISTAQQLMFTLEHIADEIQGNTYETSKGMKGELKMERRLSGQKEPRTLGKKNKETLSKFFRLLQKEVDEQRSESTSYSPDQFTTLKTLLDSVDCEIERAQLLPFDQSEITSLDDLFDGVLERQAEQTSQNEETYANPQANLSPEEAASKLSSEGWLSFYPEEPHNANPTRSAETPPVHSMLSNTVRELREVIKQLKIFESLLLEHNKVCEHHTGLGSNPPSYSEETQPGVKTSTGETASQSQESSAEAQRSMKNSVEEQSANGELREHRREGKFLPLLERGQASVSNAGAIKQQTERMSPFAGRVEFANLEVRVKRLHETVATLESRVNSPLMGETES